MSASKETRIKAVIFDVGGVLWPTPQAFWTPFEEKYGMKKESILEIYKSAEIAPFMQALERGEICADEFHGHFTEVYSKKTGIKFHEPMKITTTNTGHVPIIPAMLEAVKTLRANGFKTAILTNNFFLDRSKLIAPMPFETTLFDVVVESSKCCLRKPDPKIYQYTLKRLECAPDEAVFLDDTEEYVKAANALGILTIKVSSQEPEKAIQQLEQVVNVPLVQQ